MRPRFGLFTGKGEAVVGQAAAFAIKAADLQATTAQLKGRALTSASQAARTGLMVLVARDALLAVLTAALGLGLYGLHLLVAKWIDPAAAAMMVAGATLTGLGLLGWLGLANLRRKIEAKLSGWR